jgi:hypothetical protein
MARTSRQFRAMRQVLVATAVLLTVVLALGVTALVLRGPAFFVFRSAGTGETPASGLQETQGPGQPGHQP